MSNLANRFIRDPGYSATRVPGGLLVTRTSLFTGSRNSMILDIRLPQLTDYAEGRGLIQEIFPNLNADEREFIQSGATPSEWNTMFPSSEDE